jgi:putative NIF3 family GTP cyclohydrolase 1 type 2
MKVKEMAAVVEKITPLGLAQPWDNVGLLIGAPNRTSKRASDDRCDASRRGRGEGA